MREPVPATGDFYLKSITSYRTLENLLYLDADGSVLAPLPSVPALVGLPVAAAGRFDLTPIARESLTTDSWAVYASGICEMTDRFALTLGVRYTHENKDYSNRVILPATGAVKVV